MQIQTASGPGSADLDEPAGLPLFLLALTHGAGGGVQGADLMASRDAGLELGGVIARVLQPYRVRGVRAPGAAARQDADWLEIIGALRARYPGIPLVQGGRSNGARLGCRTAQHAGASGVIALAFPLHPPGRPDRSRAQELRAAGVGVLAISGSRDPFGVPDAGDVARLVVVPGAGHALTGGSQVIKAEVRSWLAGLLQLPSAAGPPEGRRRGGR